LDSIEDLEAAIDALDGIDEEGLEGPNLAREARVRSVYLEWCKEYGKEPDESRFPTFYNNLLMMESMAEQDGKALTLNKYADCTEDEYLEIMVASGTPTSNAAKSLMETAVSEDIAGDADILAALQAVADAEVAASQVANPEKMMVSNFLENHVCCQYIESRYVTYNSQ
jgi:hypothetical protein